MDFGRYSWELLIILSISSVPIAVILSIVFLVSRRGARRSTHPPVPHPLTDESPGQKRSFAWKIFLIGTISTVSWLITLIGRYLLWLEYYDYFNRQLILVCAFAVAVTTTAYGATLLRHRGADVWARAISFAMVPLIVAVALLPWNKIFGWTWFVANHDKFATLANMARQEKLHADSSGWFEQQDASSLTFNHLDTQDVPLEVSPGRVLMLGMSNEEVSENMYLYVYGRPDAARLNPCKLKETTFDDYYRCTGLGESWWWLQRKD